MSEIEFSLAQKKRKICVIGSTGFIGFACTKRLVEAGFQNIFCIYRNENKKARMFSTLNTQCITFLHAQLERPDSIYHAIEGADIVINASGIAKDWGIKREIWNVNVQATQAMVEIIKEMQGNTHFIHLSTAAVYGYDEEIKKETTPLIKSDPFYTASKVDIHTWLRGEIKKQQNFPITMLAPTIVWGPGDQIYVPTIKNMLKKKQVVYMSRAKEVDFIYIDDLVDAVLSCFFNKRSYNQEFIISGSAFFTFNQYIEKIAEFADLPKPRFTIPWLIYMGFAGLSESVAWVINFFNPYYHPIITRLAVRISSRTYGLSNDKARAVLGFKPKMDLDTGMQKLKEYMRK